MLATSPVPTSFDADSIRIMETADLRRELARAIDLTAKHLTYLAAVWAELEKRGEDLAPLRSGLAVYLPHIAAGTVLPETVIRFAGNVTLLRAAASLPPDQQLKLASGEPVVLAVRQGDTFTHRMLPVHALSFEQVRQVFGERCIRSEAEQIAILTATEKALKPERSMKYGDFKADRDGGVILMGRKRLDPVKLLQALADLASKSEEAPGTDSPSVSARLTKEEHETLRQRAAGKPIASIVRAALKATGMI